MASDPTQPGGRDGMRPASRRQPDLLGEEDADIPPPPYAEGEDPLDGDSQARLQRMSRRGRVLPGLLVLAAIGAFVAIVWWAYSAAEQSETPTEIPVVEAEPGDEKVRPESEGGMEVPNRDKLIYEQLDAGEGEPEVERLLPPPEEPLEPPAPPPVEAAPTESPSPESPPAATAIPETAGLTPPPPPQEIQPSELPAGEMPADESAAGESTGGATAAPDAVEPGAVPEAEPPAPEVPAPEAAPAPDTPTPAATAAGAFRIQLAAVKDESGARAEWERLQKAHAALLGDLHPTIERADLGDQGVFFRIQGGPLPSRDAAAGICDRLKQQGQACIVVAP